MGSHAVFQIHVTVTATGAEVISSDVVDVDDEYRFVSLTAYPDRAAAFDVDAT